MLRLTDRRDSNPGRKGDTLLSLMRGRSVTSEEIERVVGRDFSEPRFAALCNEIALATTGRQPASMLAISEHVRTQQDGIDSDWQVEVFGTRSNALPLLRSGLNVFECRFRALDSEERNRPLAGLLSQVRGAVDNAFRRTRRRPDRYVLFTNLRLSAPNETPRRQLERMVLSGYDRSQEVEVEIIGAEGLAGYLNRLPYLRAAFLEPSGLQIGREAWRQHARAVLSGANTDLVGREMELTWLRSMLNDPTIRVITLSGPHNVGKTRLALEATARWSRETMVATDARAITPDRLARLVTPGKEIIVIVEDCSPMQAKELVAGFENQHDLKLLLTIVKKGDNYPFSSEEKGLVVPLFSSLGAPNIDLRPMPDSEIRRLLNRAVTGLDDETESWIVREAAGNPGIVLAVAGLHSRLRDGAASLRDALRQAMEHKIVSESGYYGYRILRLLSLMNRVRATGEPDGEIGTICRLYGDGLEPAAVMNALRAFRGAGIIRQAGDLVEVVPVFLANQLAFDAVRERPEQIGSLIEALGSTGRLREIPRESAQPTRPKESSSYAPTVSHAVPDRTSAWQQVQT